MSTAKTRLKMRIRRHHRIRIKVRGSAERPRLCVFRSSRHIYAQLIDDAVGKTLASSSSNETGFPAEGGAKGSNVAGARRVGELLASRAVSRGINKAVFDRAGYKYHGRVRALADGARSQGLTL
jgi:large subunit ribosomal protein L18